MAECSVPGVEKLKSALYSRDESRARGKRAASKDPYSSNPSSPLRSASVRFNEEHIVIGIADENYDRSSIKVDLTNSPYALFHKDYLLMKKPTEYSPKANRRPSTPAFSNEDGATTDDLFSSDEDDLEDAGKSPMGGLVSNSSSGSDSSASATLHRRISSLEKRKASRPNFSGIWQRSSVEGFAELLIFSGVPKALAAKASQRRPLHIIDHDDDYVRVMVKNGLVKSDCHYIIGDIPVIEKTGTTEYEVVMDWGDATGDGKKHSLVLTSMGNAPGKGTSGQEGSVFTEMIAIRTLEDDGNTLILQQIVRRPNSAEEARARHVFKRVTDVDTLGLRRPSSKNIIAKIASKRPSSERVAEGSGLILPNQPDLGPLPDTSQDQ